MAIAVSIFTFTSVKISNVTHVINHYVYQQQFLKRDKYCVSRNTCVSASLVKESYGWSVKSFDPTSCTAILLTPFVISVNPMHNHNLLPRQQFRQLQQKARYRTTQ